MAKRKDPFGKSNMVFNTLVNNLYKQVNTNQVLWKIDASTVAGIVPLLNKWNSRWGISKNRQTSNSVDRKATVTARKALTKYLRPFVQKWIHYNSALSEADIMLCGFVPHIKTRSRIGAPVTVPNMAYKINGTHLIEAFFRQQPNAAGVSRRAKPDDVDSVRIVYFIGNEIPDDPDDFPKSITGKNSPLKLNFNPSDAGKKVTFAACWVTKTQLLGNFCNVFTMRIP